MTTPTREQVSAWVAQADAYASSQTSDFQEHGEIAAERLCALAMSAGRDQGLREATEVCEAMSALVIKSNTSRGRTNSAAVFSSGLLDECATAIEQLRGK